MPPITDSDVHPATVDALFTGNGPLAGLPRGPETVEDDETCPTCGLSKTLHVTRKNDAVTPKSKAKAPKEKKADDAFECELTDLKLLHLQTKLVEMALLKKHKKWARPIINKLGSIAALHGPLRSSIYQVNEQHTIAKIPEFVARRVLRVFGATNVTTAAKAELRRLNSSRPTSTAAASTSTAVGKQPVRK